MGDLPTTLNRQTPVSGSSDGVGVNRITRNMQNDFFRRRCNNLLRLGLGRNQNTMLRAFTDFCTKHGIEHTINSL